MSETFEAATVEAALEAAAAKMGASAQDLDYEVVEEKEDFWGMGDGSVVIKAWKRSASTKGADSADAGETDAGEAVAADSNDSGDEARAPEASGEAASKPAELRESEDEAQEAERGQEAEDEPRAGEAAATAEPAERQDKRATKAAPGDESGEESVEPSDVSGMLEQIFHDMEFDCTVEVEPEDGGFLATIDGADKDAILEGNGRCLSALELLVNNAYGHRLPQGCKIRVDAGDFRNKRDEELSDLAFQVAHSAKQSGRTQETQPLNPYERRLVHLALAEDPAVTTRSRGSGFLKNVQVIPSGGGRDRSRGRRG